MSSKNESHPLFKQPDIAVVIKVARMRWFEHVTRMDEAAIPKSLLYVESWGSQTSRGTKIYDGWIV